MQFMFPHYRRIRKQSTVEDYRNFAWPQRKYKHYLFLETQHGPTGQKLSEVIEYYCNPFAFLVIRQLIM